MTRPPRKNAWRHGTTTGYSYYKCRCEPCKAAAAAAQAALRTRAAETVHIHGYGGYTGGCRCEVCRAAKADYARARRAEGRRRAALHGSTPGDNRNNAWAPGSERHVATGVKHGTRFAYEERGCRCRDCTSARTAADRKYRRARAAS